MIIEIFIFLIHILMDQNTQQSANNGVNPSTGTEENKEVIVGGVF